MPFSPSAAVCFLLAVIIFVVPSIRRAVFAILRVGFVFIVIGGAAGGIVMIMNNETIFEEPGTRPRVLRFLTMNSAAASKDGSGAVTCDLSKPVIAQPDLPSTPEEGHRHHPHAAPKQPRPATTSTPAAGEAPEDSYPELVMRTYPGLPRRKLYQLARETVDSLGGWKVTAANPAAYTLECVYTARLFSLEDDVRITVRPDGSIDVCSRSGSARPDSTSLLRFFPGDLGANIGHIKEFYEALDPKTDAAYQEEQQRENAQQPR
ncbi:MAG TPA: DUF1499 domain-containing protein [Candidatus Binataceae bacterium]|nr:DUF1499 domain-containing protein [Candidatus Binataceae bacterium]